MMLSEEEAGLRLDALLVKRYPERSRTYFQYLIESGCVLLNGKPVKKKDKGNLGDLLNVNFLQEPAIDLKPQEIPLSIIYEDDHLIAINKPEGLVVHPGAGNPDGTFINGLIHYLQMVPEGGESFRPGIVHRLDKDTSGVLLAAKTATCHAKLVDLFKDRKMEKEYIAIVKGKPKEGWVDAPIGRHPIHRQLMCVKEDGKEALTFIEVLETYKSYSLVRAIPKTGRTHQIRVHLKHLGTPVLGDSIYGKEDERLFLHAAKLSFIHPITNLPLVLTAPVPASFKKTSC